MKILITGATGFTGSYIVPLLLAEGHEVRCLVRPSSNRQALPAKSVEWCYGNLDNVDSLIRACKDMEVLVNVASIGFGHAPNIVQAAKRKNLQRAIFISTTAIFTQLNASSKSIRLAAEKAIQSSGLDYTILRPTMIYGSSQDRNMCRLINYLKKWPVIPVVGNGESLQQPVYVGDVVQAVASCVSSASTVRKAYNIPGEKALTFIEAIDTICKLIGRNVQKAHIPVKPVLSMLNVLESRGVFLPIKSEQILRLNEDKVFDYRDARLDFGYAPRSFEEGISLEMEEMMT